MEQADQSRFNRDDRDLLVRLDQKVDSLQVTVQDLKDGTVARIQTLEREKANRDELQEVQEKVNQLQKHVNDNIEARMRSLETSGISRSEYSQKHDELIAQISSLQKIVYTIMGGLALLQVLLRFIK